MGGAFTAVADDGSAPYWNPAGITRIKYLVFTPAIGLEGKYDKAGDIIDTGTFPPKFKDDSEFGLASLIYAGLTSRYVALNGFIDVNGYFKPSGRAASAAGESYGYGALTVAGNFGEKLSIGVNFKTIQAKVVEYKMDADAPDDGSKNMESSADGDGMAADIGILYRLSDRTRIGLTGRNIVGKVDWKNGVTKHYKYDGSNNGPDEPWNPPYDIPKTYALGVAFNPYKSLTVAVDAEMIDASGDTNDQTRFHIGLEQTALWKSIALRLGAYTKKDEDTAITAGLGLKLGPLLLDLAGVKAENNGAYITAGLKF